MADLKITQLPAITQNADAYVLPIADLTPTTRQISVKNFLKKSALFIVAPVGQGGADYYATGTNDHLIIQTAINALPASGGEIILREGTYNINGTIVIANSNITLRGQGNATLLQLGANANVDMIQVTGTGTVNVKLKSFKMDGNNNNQSSGNGIVINTPWAVTDTQHVVEEVDIWNVKGDGLQIAASALGTRVVHVLKTRAIQCYGNGFANNGTDCVFYDCVADHCSQHGFYMNNVTPHLTNCKAFGCGAAGTIYSGFYLNADRGYYTSCEAQDNNQNGWYLTGSVTNHTFVGCIADGNGKSNTPGYTYGFYLNGAIRNVFTGLSAINNDVASQTQTFGIYLDGASDKNTFLGATFFQNASDNYHDVSSGKNVAIMQGLESGNPTRLFFTTGGEILQMDNVPTWVFSTALEIAMYSASDRTMQITNNGGGKANLTVQNDLTNSGDAHLAGSGKNVGFYGISPIPRALLATGAGHSVDDVITVLQNLGLIRQS